MAIEVRRARVIVTFALAGVVATACGAANPASPQPTPSAATPAATPQPTPTVTPTARPTPTLAPSPSPRVDPTVALEIGAPYTIAELDPVTAAMLEAGMTKGLGAMATVVEFGARQVSKDGTPVAMVLGMRFPGVAIPGDAAFLDATVGGAAGPTGAKVTKATIDGQPIRLGEAASAAFAAYLQDDMVVFALGASSKEMKAVVAALIKANP